MDYSVVALIVVLVVVLVLVYAFSGAGTLVAANKSPTVLKLQNGTTNVVIPANTDYDSANASSTNQIAGIVLANNPTGSVVRLTNNQAATVAVYQSSAAGGSTGTGSLASLATGDSAICIKTGINIGDWNCNVTNPPA